jgi:hypothetical protein
MGLRLDSTAADLSVRDAARRPRGIPKSNFIAYDVVPDAQLAAAAVQR